ncbi:MULTISPECIES: hypothetical protein [Kitasatospora]|uniref:Uncharacterized protein n=1 Tax=Kitasatospora setae (strain ATCC 33774 / DSM 43861 / JCM 3304 / KCC A-0304 / NBRC 14216 / KM-6054) TaxID=452652 RepID=E4MZW3_KITSK|nr:MULTISPECIES: hypothetical protein [Kitasatospora]BAJ30047.1 hypothetical protein KSE_42620 [Kitasatospora setae KM-6054]
MALPDGSPDHRHRGEHPVRTLSFRSRPDRARVLGAVGVLPTGLPRPGGPYGGPQAAPPA